MARRKQDAGTASAPDDRQQALLEFIVAQSSVVFYIADLTGDTPVRFISSNVEAITGHKPADFLGQANFGFGQIHPDDRDRYLKNIELLRDRGTLTHEYRFRSADGDYLWFRDELRVLGSTDDGAEFVGAMLNITAEREAEEQRRASDEIVRRMIEVLPLPVSMIRHSDRKVLFENPAMHKMMGDTPDTAPQFAGANDMNPAEREEYERLLKQNGKVDGYEMQFRQPDGTVLPVAISSRVITFRAEEVIVAAYVDLSERKAREQALKLAHETLEDAIEALDDGFVLYDSSDRLVMVNDQYKKFHGELEPLLKPGAYWPDITRKRGEAGLFRAAADGLEDWLSGQMAQRGVAKHEEFPASEGRWFDYTHKPTRQGGFVSVWRDISARKQMEHDLRESEAMIRRVLEACPLPIRMWELDTELVLYESPAWRTMFGRDTQDKELNAENTVYVNLDDRIRYQQRLRETGAVDNMEVHVRRASGEKFWASVSARVIEFRGRDAVVSSIVDLSERMEMEQTLRDREEQFRSMVEGHPLPVWMVDIDTYEILYESPSAAEMVGRAEPSGGAAYSIDHFASRDECARLNDQLRREGALRDVEVQLKKTDGTEFWAALSDRMVTYGQRQVSITSFTDLTQRREAEAELARQREIMHQSEKLSALGELLAGVSHELNNPLSVLVGQAMLLKDTAPDEKTAQRADRIEKAADRCARIVKTFLSMARQETRSFIPVDVNDALEGALDVAGYSLRTAGIQVIRRFEENLPQVLADADQLVQVFTNLILNAEQAMQEVDHVRKLRVVTSYRKSSDQVVVKIKDTGPGISDEVRSRIFEPLYTTKETGSGTGLGLALCHRIIEAHGGMIEVEPPTGRGASFAIRFNCQRNRALETHEPEEEAADEGRLSVLVVDDEVEVAQILADILELDGHNVEMVSSAHAALQKIERRAYDVVLSDVRMPGMDGPAFFAALQATNPGQIDGLGFMTGDTLSQRVSDFLGSAGRPYLEKPITPNDLRDIIARLMRAKTERRVGAP